MCVKLSGDGTNIGKRLHVLNFTFTMQDEREKAYSAECYHVLDIVKEPETYEKLKLALADIVADIQATEAVDSV